MKSLQLLSNVNAGGLDYIFKFKNFWGLCIKIYVSICFLTIKKLIEMYFFVYKEGNLKTFASYHKYLLQVISRVISLLLDRKT